MVFPRFHPQGMWAKVLFFAGVLLIAIFSRSTDKFPTDRNTEPRDFVKESLSKNQQSTYDNNVLFTVVKVVDGDTIRLNNGEKVRLIGIDTPEATDNPKAERDSQRTGQDIPTITRLGKEAGEILREMILGQKVRLEFDARERDKYGRLLCYVFLPDSQDPSKEIFVNAEIIRQGYAAPLNIRPNVKYANLFRKLYKEAKAENKGLWKENALVLESGDVE